MACTRSLKDPETIRRFISTAQEALNRALASCEDHNGSYRATRLSGMTFPAAIALRNTGIRLAGRLAPGLMLRQMDPLASWTPPL